MEFIMRIQIKPPKSIEIRIFKEVKKYYSLKIIIMNTYL